MSSRKALIPGSIGIGLVLAALAWGSAGQGQAPTVGQDGDRLVLLGTQGGPIATPARAGIASLLVVSGKRYLIDCGDGVVGQLARAGYQPSQIPTIFITHHHLDHEAGLTPLMGMAWFAAGLSGQQGHAVQIIGPPATGVVTKAALDFVRVSERTFGGIGHLPPAAGMFTARDVGPGTIFDDGTVRVSAIENTHFRHATTSPDGVRDLSLSYRFDTPAGSVVFTGDTGPSEALVTFAQGADLLVSEISMLFVEPPLPEAAGLPVDPRLREQLHRHHTEEHLSPEAVGQLATRARVGRVVLTHLVPGGKSSDAQRYAAEVGKYFAGPVTVGDDLMAIPLAAPFAAKDHATPVPAQRRNAPR